MSTFNKFDLMEMSDVDLLNTAHELGIFPTGKETKEEVVYQIINEQAARGATTTAPRRRQRISKPKEAEHIISANQNESKSLEKNKKKKTTQKQTEEEVASAEDKATVQATPQPAEKEKTTTKKRKTRAGKKETETAEAATITEEKTLFDEAPEQPAPTATEEQLPEPQPEEHTPLNEDTTQKNEEDEPDFIILQDIPNIENEIDEGFVNNIYDKNINAYYKENDNTEYPSEATTTHNNDYNFDDIIIGSGVLEVAPENFGFLRSSDYNYLNSPDDIYVPQNIIKSYGLSTGDVVEGTIRIPKENEKYFSLNHINKINGRLPHEIRDRVSFEHLTPLFP